MPTVKIKFVVDNEVQMSRLFTMMAADVDDLTEPFEEMASSFYDFMSRVFESEGSYEKGGASSIASVGRWAELSPNYKKWKMKHFPGKKILDLNGRMKRAAIQRGSSENVTVIEKQEMKLGLKTPYAIYHQRGTKHMPQRKILELTPGQKTRWVHIMHGFLYRKRKEHIQELRLWQK